MGRLVGNLEFSFPVTTEVRHQPRPYQAEALTAILDARDRGVRRALLTMATGGGKTQTFAWLIDRMGEEARPALILAHRDELIRQAADRVRSLLPGLRVGVEKAEETAPRGSDVVVASIQTLGRKGSKRLQWLEEAGAGVVIADEAHHSTAESWLDVFRRFGVMDGDTFLLGVTATPHRGDARKLGMVYQEEVYRYDILQAMQEGYLCDLRCYRVLTSTDISNVGMSHGDFNERQLAAAVNNYERTLTAVRHWQERAEDRLTVVFCADVAHAHDAAAVWRENGVAAEAVDAKTPSDERRAILNRWRRGETRVVTNVGILTEGFDLPELSCVVMLRPTQSAILYTQCAGRALRVAPGKIDAIILDVVDNCRRHSLIQAPVLLGLPANLDLEGQTLRRASEVVAQLGAGASSINTTGDTLRHLESRLEEWDVFASAFTLSSEVAAATSLAWAQVPGGYYLSAGSGREARLQTDMLGALHLSLVNNGEVVGKAMLGKEVSAAFQAADRMVREAWPSAAGLIEAASPWREDEPSDKQQYWLQKKGVPIHAIAQMTKGQATQLLTRLFAGGTNG